MNKLLSPAEVLQALIDDGWLCVPCLAEIIQDDYVDGELIFEWRNC